MNPNFLNLFITLLPHPEFHHDVGERPNYGRSLIFATVRSDFSEAWLVRLLMTVRSEKDCRTVGTPAEGSARVSV